MKTEVSQTVEAKYRSAWPWRGLRMPWQGCIRPHCVFRARGIARDNNGPRVFRDARRRVERDQGCGLMVSMCIGGGQKRKGKIVMLPRHESGDPSRNGFGVPQAKCIGRIEGEFRVALIQKWWRRMPRTFPAARVSRRRISGRSARPTLSVVKLAL